MEHIRPQPLYKQIYNYLRKEILSGRLTSEKRINEVHLAKKLNVSRGPVREAIQKIEKEGLIIRDARNKLFVYKPTVEDLVNIYQCRMALESLAAELAAINITQSNIDMLSSILQETEEIINSDLSKGETIDRFTEISTKFHNQIIIFSENPRLDQEIKQLKSLVFYYRQYNSKYAWRRHEIYEEHKMISEAICTRDKKKAAELMKKHIEHDLQHLIKLFSHEEENDKP